MNNQTKAIAGVSLVTVFLFIFHLAHLVDTVIDYTEKSSEEVFKNAPVYIILKDSLNDGDTMLMEEYLDKKNRK